MGRLGEIGRWSKIGCQGEIGRLCEMGRLDEMGRWVEMGCLGEMSRLVERGHWGYCGDGCPLQDTERGMNKINLSQGPRQYGRSSHTF